MDILLNNKFIFTKSYFEYNISKPLFKASEKTNLNFHIKELTSKIIYREKINLLVLLLYSIIEMKLLFTYKFKSKQLFLSVIRLSLLIKLQYYSMIFTYERLWNKVKILT